MSEYWILDGVTVADGATEVILDKNPGILVGDYVWAEYCWVEVIRIVWATETVALIMA